MWVATNIHFELAQFHRISLTGYLRVLSPLSGYKETAHISESPYCAALHYLQPHTSMALPFSWIFCNWYSGGWSPIGTTRNYGHRQPYCAASNDYDDGETGGMMIGRGNRSTRRKSAQVPLCPPQTPQACPDANPGPGVGKPATNIYGAA
jgi:hypothetical protein